MTALSFTPDSRLRHTSEGDHREPSAEEREGVLVRQSAAVDALCLHAAPEADVRETDGDPVAKTHDGNLQDQLFLQSGYGKDTHQVDKPSKYFRCPVAHSHECQQGDDTHSQDANPRSAVCTRQRHRPRVPD